ncbi:hypothetical protein JVU11DRAFT_1458 [Chiua virens]|nr:hypothetical protein JVU11DRAFT_1458 [Chiua virens]
MQRSQTIVLTSQILWMDQALNAPAQWHVDPLFSTAVGADSKIMADRNVLAIYLRRAGQDILAIGQYLEDEKNGTLQHE